MLKKGCFIFLNILMIFLMPMHIYASTKKDINSFAHARTISAKTYTGDNITVSNPVLGLTEGKDYVVKYSNNKEPGMAKMTVRGVNNYTGSFSVCFKINKVNISSLRVDKIAYNFFYEYKGGKAVTPNNNNFKLVDKEIRGYSGMFYPYKELKLGTDFKIISKQIMYKCVNNNGTTKFYKAKVKGTGKYYTGTAYIRYSLKKQNIKKCKIKINQIKNVNGRFRFSIEVRDSYTNNKLSANKDYRIVADKNDMTRKKITFHIEGIRNYCWSTAKYAYGYIIE